MYKLILPCNKEVKMSGKRANCVDPDQTAPLGAV